MKEILSLANTSGSTVTANGIIPLPVTQRILTCNNRLSSNGSGATIQACCNSVDYNVTAKVTFTAAAAGDVTITIQQNGAPIGGTASMVTVGTAATEYHTVTIPAELRVSGTATIAISTSAEITVETASLIVEAV